MGGGNGDAVGDSSRVVLCWACKHRTVGRKCAAFPDGIPDEILFSHTRHMEPYPGDHGIQFEWHPDLDEGDRQRVIELFGLDRRGDDEDDDEDADDAASWPVRLARRIAKRLRGE